MLPRSPLVGILTSGAAMYQHQLSKGDYCRGSLGGLGIFNILDNPMPNTPVKYTESMALNE